MRTGSVLLGRRPLDDVQVILPAYCRVDSTRRRHGGSEGAAAGGTCGMSVNFRLNGLSVVLSALLQLVLPVLLLRALREVDDPC